MNKVDDFILNLPLWQQEIVEYLRVIILQSSLGVSETLKYKIPYYEYKKHLCYINPRKKEVVLGFIQGKLLSETCPFLSGDQKYVRHIVIKEITKELDGQIRFTLQEAILLNDELYKLNKKKW